MRKVLRNDMRRIGNRSEPFLRVCSHKTENFINTGHVHARSDVDQHQCRKQVRVIGAFGLAFGQKRSDATQ